MYAIVTDSPQNIFHEKLPGRDTFNMNYGNFQKLIIIFEFILTHIWVNSSHKYFAEIIHLTWKNWNWSLDFRFKRGSNNVLSQNFWLKIIDIKTYLGQNLMMKISPKLLILCETRLKIGFSFPNRMHKKWLQNWF